MKLSAVQPIAEDLLELFRPACEDIEIAGSVRRKKPEVHDLEFVLLPVRDTDMFGDPQDTSSKLDMRIGAMIGCNVLRWDMEVKRNGPRLIRLIHNDSALIVELYIADAANFGNLLTIRTGCSEFSRWLVTQHQFGGGMPKGMGQQAGYLRKCTGEVIPCRTERLFFEALGVRWYEPEERTPETAARLWRRTGQ